MTTRLDKLQQMQEMLTELFNLSDDELRAAFADGFEDEKPPNDNPVTSDEWAHGLLAWIAEGSRMLAYQLNPNPGVIVSRIRGGPLLIGDEAYQPPEEPGE